MDRIDFAITRRAKKIIAMDCYFKIGGIDTSTHLDTALFTICTRCSIISSQNIVGINTLDDKLILRNFSTT